jgi:O-antigen/teichoic acid export membrane protein
MSRGEVPDSHLDTAPDRQDRLPTFIRGAGFNLVGRGVGQASQLLAHVALARFYGPAAFGLFALGWTVYRLGSFLAPLGLESGVMRYGSMSLAQNRGEVRAVARRTLGMGTLAGVLFGVALYLLAPELATVFGEPGLTPLLRIFAVGLPLAAAMRVSVAATRISQEMSYSVLSEYLLQPVGFLALVVATYLLGHGVMGGAVAAVASYGLAAGAAVYFTFRIFPRSHAWPSRPIVSRRELITFSLPAAFAAIFGIAIIWADRLFLGYFMTADAVGVYQAASQSALIFMVIPTAAGTILAPLIVDLYSRGRLAELSTIFSFSLRWGLILATPALLVVFFVPADFLHFLFGIEYTAGATALRVLTAGQVVAVATGTAGFGLVMVGRQREWLIISAGAMTVNLVLNWLLIPRFGMVGAATATSVAICFLYVPAMLAVRKTVGLRLRAQELGDLLYAATAAGIVLLVINALPLGPTTALVVNASAAFLAFGGFLIVRGVSPEEVSTFRSLARPRSMKRRAGDDPGTSGGDRC